MTISADTENRLGVGLTSFVAGTEIADAIDLNTVRANPTGDITIDANGVASLALTSARVPLSTHATRGIGYATGAGGAVTQATNRSTGVTVQGMSGAITTDATSLAAGAEASFTVTNGSVAVGDVVVVCLRSGATAGTSIPVVTAVAAGSFQITLTNLHASTADTGASIINFVIIKAVSA